MTEITFQGIAPIPTGTNVEMDVDDVKNPKEAYSIFDLVHGITYHFRPKPEKVKAETITPMRAYKADPGGRIKVTVNRAVVFQNSTVLTVFIGQPWLKVSIDSAEIRIGKSVQEARVAVAPGNDVPYLLGRSGIFNAFRIIVDEYRTITSFQPPGRK